MPDKTTAKGNAGEKTVSTNKIIIHNVHTHVFTLDYIPKRFMFPGLVSTFKNQGAAKVAAKVLKGIIPFSKSDKPQRMTVFAEAARHQNQVDIFEDILGFYPPGTRFGVLSVDLDHMKAGKADKDFIQQINDLSKIKNGDKDSDDETRQKGYQDLIIPFIGLDPRRSRDGTGQDLKEMIRKYVEEHNFGGIKIYPPLGFYPFDERLMPTYHYAEEKQIPIIVHCSPGGIHWQGKFQEGWKIHPKTNEVLKKAKMSKFSDYFTHPANYYWVLDECPNLKLCFGHFGGAEEWTTFLQNTWPKEKQEKETAPPERSVCQDDVSWLSVIQAMIREPKYPNIYADISYTAYKQNFLPLIKVMISNEKLRPFILYGSDCYMVQMDVSERAFSINVRGYLGEDDYRQIAETNPTAFYKQTG